MQDTGQRWSQVKAQARERIYKKSVLFLRPSGARGSKFELYKKKTQDVPREGARADAERGFYTL